MNAFRRSWRPTAATVALAAGVAVVGRRLARTQRATRRKAVTINRGRVEVEQAWHNTAGLAGRPEQARSVAFRDAPGNRGTEVVVEVRGARRAAQLEDDLRRFKQQLETGEVVRSESTPEGHRLGGHLAQRPAQPLEESVR
jgi:uncharacterized membrane protein